MTAKLHSKLLSQLSSGEKATVSSVSSGNNQLSTKLLSLGFVAGTVVQVVSFAPLGDPMKVRALGYELSLRLSEAAHIQVESV